MTLSFRKMHGLGNDFVIVDNRDGAHAFSPDRIRLISDRHFGVGCDQFIVLEPSTKTDVFMRIYNDDGSEAEACGNATRCVASLIMTATGKDNCVIETVAGELPCRIVGGGLIEADLGPARNEWQAIPLSHACDTLHLPLPGDPVAVNMGNPHCVLFVPDADTAKVAEEGPRYETDPLFPRKTNVEFASIIGPDKIRMRVWERGVGITMACGSAACATIVAAVRRGLTGRRAELVLDGGSLILEWRETDGNVLITGPVAYIFDGTLKGL